MNVENKVAGFLTYGLNTQFTVRNEGYIGRDNSYTSLSPFGSVYEEDGVTLNIIQMIIIMRLIH